MTKYLLKASDEAEFKRRYAARLKRRGLTDDYIEVADHEWKVLVAAGIAEPPK